MNLFLAMGLVATAYLAGCDTHHGPDSAEVLANEITIQDVVNGDPGYSKADQSAMQSRASMPPASPLFRAEEVREIRPNVYEVIGRIDEEAVLEYHARVNPARRRVMQQKRLMENQLLSRPYVTAVGMTDYQGEPVLTVFTNSEADYRKIPNRIAGIPVVKGVISEIERSISYGIESHDAATAHSAELSADCPGCTVGGGLQAGESISWTPESSVWGRRVSATYSAGLWDPEWNAEYILSCAHCLAEGFNEPSGEYFHDYQHPGALWVEPGDWSIEVGGGGVAFTGGSCTSINAAEAAISPHSSNSNLNNQTPSPSSENLSWEPAAPTTGTVLEKYGAASGFTSGKILSYNVTINDNVACGTAMYQDQILFQHMHGPGDSGSLVYDSFGRPVAMLVWEATGNGVTYSIGSPMAVVRDFYNFGDQIHNKPYSNEICQRVDCFSF